MEIYNGYYITDICQFNDCSIFGGDRVGSTSDEQECARLVKEKKPHAIGATRYSETNCEAEYSTDTLPHAHDPHDTRRCCVFPGNISSKFIYLYFKN